MRDARFERRRQKLADQDTSEIQEMIDRTRRQMQRLARQDPAMDRDLGFPCETGQSATAFRSAEIDVVALPLAVLAVGVAAAPGPTESLPVSARTSGTLEDGVFRVPIAPPSPIWDNFTDVMLYTAAASPLIPHDVGRPRSWHRYVGRGAIATEAVASSLLVTELSKRFVTRPRPWTQMDPSLWPAPGFSQERTDEERLASTGAIVSMPSGHTSMVGAASFSLATMGWLERREPTSFRHGLGFALAGVATGLTGYGRVRANAHWPTDVIVGGALGASIGIAIPAMHAAPAIPVRPLALVLGANPELTRLRVLPGAGRFDAVIVF